MRQSIPSQIDTSVGVERTNSERLLHNHIHHRALGLVRVRNRHLVYKRQRVVQGRNVLAATVRVRARLFGRVHVSRPSRHSNVLLVRRAKATLRHLDCRLDMDRVCVRPNTHSALQTDHFYSGLRRLFVLFD